jgi:hypothetical protein
VREAFRDRAAGAGPTEIARRLNALGLRPRSKRRKSLFTASAVQSMLENDFYAGWVRHKGERQRGVPDSIITDELFLARQLTGRVHSCHARDMWPLTGATCSECGGPIWQSKSGRAGELYYREASRVPQRPCSVDGHVAAGARRTRTERRDSRDDRRSAMSP